MRGKTMLTTVTITGADDRTRPTDLCELSEEFPFVEWGLLLSASRMGAPRYPSRSWLHDFENVMSTTPDRMHHAMHFCGQCTRDTLAGDPRWFDGIHPDRIQLNGFATPSTDAFLVLARRLTEERPRFGFILQARDARVLEATAVAVAEIGSSRTAVLYDPSGGRGITTTEWPTLAAVHMGYAGGLGPANVEAVLKLLLSNTARGPFWIDMETRVRTGDAEDKLDLALVRDVLVKAQRCMEERT